MIDNGALVGKFHRKLDEIASPSSFIMLPGYDSEELILDGRFTLEQLKEIVKAWEEYQQFNLDNKTEL